MYSQKFGVPGGDSQGVNENLEITFSPVPWSPPSYWKKREEIEWRAKLPSFLRRVVHAKSRRRIQNYLQIRFKNFLLRKHRAQTSPIFLQLKKTAYKQSEHRRRLLSFIERGSFLCLCLSSFIDLKTSNNTDKGHSIAVAEYYPNWGLLSREEHSADFLKQLLRRLGRKGLKKAWKTLLSRRPNRQGRGCHMWTGFS